MTALIVIPARGGSKGIPRKNLRLMGGKPLMSYAVEAALKAGCAEKVVVSTDDEEIRQLAESLGAESLMRGDDLSRDEATLDPVILDAAQRVNGDYDCVITVQPTSPFVTPQLIDEAYQTFKGGMANTVFTVTNDTHLDWEIEDGAFIPLYEDRLNRQQLPQRYKETGAVVCCARRTLLSERTRFAPPFAVIEVPFERSIDIDDRFNWAYAEALMELRSVAIVIDNKKSAERQLALCAGLTKHAIRFLVPVSAADVMDLMAENNFPPHPLQKATLDDIAPLAGDVAILDVTEIETGLVEALQKAGGGVVCFGVADAACGTADVLLPDFDAGDEASLLSAIRQVAMFIKSTPIKAG